MSGETITHPDGSQALLTGGSTYVPGVGYPVCLQVLGKSDPHPFIHRAAAVCWFLPPKSAADTLAHYPDPPPPSELYQPGTPRPQPVGELWQECCIRGCQTEPVNACCERCERHCACHAAAGERAEIEAIAPGLLAKVSEYDDQARRGIE